MKTEYNLAVETLLASKEALSGTETKLIGSLFADNSLYDGLDPHLMIDLAKAGECDGFLIDTLTKDGRNLFDFMTESELREMTKDGRNLFDFMTESELREMVFAGKELGISTALSGHLRIQDLDELSRINPDIVGVRGAVCAVGERTNGVHHEAVGEFRRQLRLRQSGEIDVRAPGANALQDGASNGWTVIDGTGKTCASILAALTEQVTNDPGSFVEVIMPDVLNTYDVIVWAEKGGHNILTQRKSPDGSHGSSSSLSPPLTQPQGGSRLLVQP